MFLYSTAYQVPTNSKVAFIPAIVYSYLIIIIIKLYIITLPYNIDFFAEVFIHAFTSKQVLLLNAQKKNPTIFPSLY